MKVANFYIFDAYSVHGDGSVIKKCKHIFATLALHAYKTVVQGQRQGAIQNGF